MSKTKKLTKAAMIAGLYAAITMATFFMSFGQIQYRISEVLTVLPAYTGLAIPGLSVGCALANVIGFAIGANPVGLVDALFGTAATLIAAIMTHYIGKSKSKAVRYLLCPLPPVLMNALIVGFEITYFFMGSLDIKIFLANALSVLIGQAVVCYGLGVPLMIILEKNNFYKRLFK